MAFFYVHYVLIYHTVTSLTYVFVPLDFRPRVTNLNSKKESFYYCKSIGIDRLSYLSVKMACDKYSALGCDK